MANSEIAAKLRDLAQEARTLQQHLRRLLEPVSLQDPATARGLEDAICELEKLAGKTETLARWAETQ